HGGRPFQSPWEKSHGPRNRHRRNRPLRAGARGPRRLPARVPAPVRRALRRARALRGLPPVHPAGEDGQPRGGASAAGPVGRGRSGTPNLMGRPAVVVLTAGGGSKRGRRSGNGPALDIGSPLLERTCPRWSHAECRGVLGPAEELRGKMTTEPA